MFIKKILINTFKYGVENRVKIFNSLKFPGFGIIIISLFSKDDSSTFTIQSLALSLFNYYLFIIFTINCHRLFLEKEVPKSLIENLKWNKRNTNFMFTSLGLAISMAVFILPVFLI